MFFLFYRHPDDGILDVFPKISDHFLKISEDPRKLVRRSHEGCQTFSENFRKFSKMPEDIRRLPKTFEEDPICSIVHQRIKEQFKRQTS